ENERQCKPMAVPNGRALVRRAQTGENSHIRGLSPVCSLPEIPLSDLVLWLDQLRLSDLDQVGGKNASLGEMIGNLSKLGVSVPGGFATTAFAFQDYLEKSGLAKRILDRLATLDVENVDALTAAGKEIRGWIVDTALPSDLDKAIR